MKINTYIYLLLNLKLFYSREFEKNNYIWLNLKMFIIIKLLFVKNFEGKILIKF